MCGHLGLLECLTLDGRKVSVYVCLSDTDIVWMAINACVEDADTVEDSIAWPDNAVDRYAVRLGPDADAPFFPSQLLTLENIKQGYRFEENW